MPLESKRTVKAVFPIANSGVPFMPKTGNSEEKMVLRVYSKDKWMLENTIKSSGAPYTDTFQVHVKTVCETSKESKYS